MRVTRSGFVAQTFIVQAGEAQADKTLKLQREEPKGKGTLQVVSTAFAWTKVTVDGKPRGHTPTGKLELTEGRHRVLVRCVPEVCPTPTVVLDKTINVKAGELIKIDAK